MAVWTESIAVGRWNLGATSAAHGRGSSEVYEIGDKLGATTLELWCVQGMIIVAGGGETIIGEGDEGEVGVASLYFVGHATVHVNGGWEGDTCT